MTAIFFAVIIGIIIGMSFPVFWFDVFTWPIVGIFSIASMTFLSIILTLGGVKEDKWEKQKHLFDYKQLFGNFYLCSQMISGEKRLFFLMRLKNSS